MNVISTVPESKVIVVKNSGENEEWQPEKIYKHLKIACENTSVQPADIMMEMNITLSKKMKTRDIQDTLIKTVSDTISEDSPDSEIVAARLLNQQLRKDVYKSYTPTPFYETVVERVKRKYYDAFILTTYTEDELRELGKHINYDKDDLFRYIGLLQETKKLLIRGQNGLPIETPQEAFMLISAYIFCQEPREQRLKEVTDFYDSLSNLELILSTPIGVGVRTRLRMYSSCAGVMVGDSATAIGQAFNDIYTLTINRAGIGANFGHIRGIGASIDNGRETHTGLVPILKVAEKISLSAVQPGSGRGGAVTDYYPFFHIELLSILELKNNKGTEDNRVRQSDHTIIFNNLFYKRFANDEDITLFYMNDVGDLYEHIGMDDFEEKYLALEGKRGIKKVKVPAKEVYSKFWLERFATARLYKVNANAFQKHSAFKIPVYNSNLCVSGDTDILTKVGHQNIALLKDKKIDIWNGQEWSNVTVRQTGEAQKVIKVVTTSGELVCTPYHKFYTQAGLQNKGKTVEKRARELLVGDKLIKCVFPIIQGTNTLNLAYENGFYSGDGCEHYKTKKMIYLHHDKMQLKEYFNGFYRVVNEEKAYKRLVLWYKKDVLKPKFFVPTATHTVESRLKWFAGVLDSNGYLTNSNGVQSFQVGSINRPFLLEVIKMLQTLGVSSKVILNYCNTKTNYMLLVEEDGIQKLLNLGLSTNRLCPTKKVPNRTEEQFVKVIAIIDENTLKDTYCFTEPKNHMGVFNGVLTGQCSEISLPSFEYHDYKLKIKPGLEAAMTSLIYDLEETGEWYKLYQHLKYNYPLPKTENFDLYKSMLAKPAKIHFGNFTTYIHNFYEIFACILAGYNLSKAKSYKDIEKAGAQLVHFLDNLIDYQEYPIPAMRKAAVGRRALGISVSGVFHYLAKKGLDYNTLGARNEIHIVMEALYYGAITESVRLSISRGKCHYFQDSNYSDGYLTIDTYNTNVDELVTVGYRYDWNKVREDVKKYGLRNSTLLTIVPASNSARVVGTTPGIDLPQDLVMNVEDKRINGKMLLPEVDKYKEYYQNNNAWNADMADYYKLLAVMQKFIDQAISINSYYDYTAYEKEVIPYSKILEDDYVATKYGIKTQYYCKTRSDDEYEKQHKSMKTADTCVGGGCTL